MSFPTTPAFVNNQVGWTPELRAHPAIDWLYKHVTSVFDDRTWDIDATTLLTSDFVLRKPDGALVNGAQAGWDAQKEIYSLFKAQYHQPTGAIVVETESGWEMMGKADLYVNVLGEPGAGEVKVKDATGKEWDAMCVGMFRFVFTKDPQGKDGIKMARSEMASDGVPALRLLLKRGAFKAEALMA